MRKCLFLAIVFLLSLADAVAQKPEIRLLTGIVADSLTGKPVEYASVALCRRTDTSLVTGAITSEKGEFRISGYTQGEYLLRCSFIGYNHAYVPVILTKANFRRPEPIRLIPSSVALNEVQVVGKIREQETGIEKTTIQVAKSTGSASGNILDVLKSQPAVTIDHNDQIYLRGNKNILVLLDGRPTTLSALDAIPASQVSNIELITSPHAAYDAEGTGGIVNIVTKQRKASGVTGSANLNWGLPDKVNGGAALSLANSVWDAGIRYSGKYDPQYITSSLDRDFLISGEKVSQQMQTRRYTETHQGSFSAGYKPGKRDLLTLDAKVSFSSLRNDQQVDGSQITPMDTVTGLYRRNDVTHARVMGEVSLNYRHRFDPSGHELSLEAFFSRTKGTRFADYYPQDRFLQKSEGGGAPTNVTVQADYFRPLFRRGKLETGLRFFSRWNNFAYNFWDLDTLSGDWILNPEYSNDLEQQEFIYAGYAMYADTLFGSLFWKAGIRAEYNTRELHQNATGETDRAEYLFPFPFVQLSSRVSATQTLALGYTRRVTRPTYPQLNPYINMIDDKIFETGNRNLDPELTGKVELSHNYATKNLRIFSYLYYSDARDFIVQVSYLTLPDTLVMTYANGEWLRKAGGGIDATLDVGRWMSLQPGISLWYSKSKGNFNGIGLSTEGLAWGCSLKASFFPWKQGEILGTFSYSSPTDLPEFYLHEIHSTDLGVRQSFLNKTLTLSVTLTDLFNSRKWIIETDNEQFTLYNESKADSRILWVGLSWSMQTKTRLNGKKPAPAETEEGLIRVGQ